MRGKFWCEVLRIEVVEEGACVVVGERLEVVVKEVIWEIYLVWEMLRPRPRVGWGTKPSRISRRSMVSV